MTADSRLIALRFEVEDLERSVRYYTELLGMGELGRGTSPTREPTARVAYGDGPTSLGLLLVQSASPSTAKSTCAGLAVSVPDRERARNALLGAGYEVTDPEPVNGPAMRSFAADPDGNEFEFGAFSADAQEGRGSPPGFGFFVADLDRSIDFYSRLLGMGVSGRIESSSDGVDPSDPLNGMTKVYLTYGDAPSAPMVSLVWSSDPKVSRPGYVTSTFAGLVIAVADPAAVGADLAAAGYDAVDPDGNRIDLVVA